jgi:hypothetical protein
MLPTDNPTDIFKKILYTAMEESRDDSTTGKFPA